jgi:hypothetical protein
MTSPEPTTSSEENKQVSMPGSRRVTRCRSMFHVACRLTLTPTSPSNSPTAIQGVLPMCRGSLVSYKVLSTRRSGTFSTDSGVDRQWIGHGTVTAGRRGTAGETRDAGISRGSRSTMKFKMRGQPRSLHSSPSRTMYQGRSNGQRAAGWCICAITKCSSLA